MGLHLSKADEELMYIPPRRRRAQHSVQHKEKPPRPATLRPVNRRVPITDPAAGGPRKVMTQRELALWLESMGFSQESVQECLQKLQFIGSKTIVDANQLVEQLLQYAPRNQTGSPLRRSSRLLRSSRNLSPLSTSTTIIASSSSPSSSSSSSSSSTPSFAPTELPSSTVAAASSSFIAHTSPINTTSPFAVSPIANVKPNLSSSLSSSSLSQPNSPCRSMHCKICFERQIDTVILRCGHVCVCSKCTPQLKLCPICRQEIVEIVKIYHV